MGASKAKKNKSAAAKQRRRTDRKAKLRQSSAAAPAPAPDRAPVPGTDRWSVPVWDYPRVAKLMVEEDGRRYEDSLTILLSQPIHMHFMGEPPEVVAPQDVMRQEGLTQEEYIESLAALHRMGLMMWDEPSRSHRPTNPAAAG